MDGCASVCTGPSANSPAGTEIKLDQMPYTEEEPELKKELESLSTSVAKPQEMLASLKLQHAAIHATMLDMEELLSTSQTQLTQLAAKVEQATIAAGLGETDVWGEEDFVTMV
ncbi:CACNA1H [Symbiodinium natans]|uniref:CACNA1H protein n=1 Tax=Symbiodinium natans TaxID=878477 RepID=A0A812UW96_9DINO|nr:CACNA1H [Symbiodinium natans]